MRWNVGDLESVVVGMISRGKKGGGFRGRVTGFWVLGIWRE